MLHINRKNVIYVVKWLKYFLITKIIKYAYNVLYIYFKTWNNHRVQYVIKI